MRRHDYVVLLGPAYSEKTRLLYRRERPAGGQRAVHTPVYVNLWRVRTDDEAAFFSSLAQMICRSERVSSLPYAGHGPCRTAATIAPAFAPFWKRWCSATIGTWCCSSTICRCCRKILPTACCKCCAAAYMERRPMAQRQIDVVVAGSAALAELAHDSTSPFNMAYGVFQGPLTADASLALARANLDCSRRALLGRRGRTLRLLGRRRQLPDSASGRPVPGQADRVSKAADHTYRDGPHRHRTCRRYAVQTDLGCHPGD